MTEQESIVRYWHSVELLQPQSAPKLKKRSSRYEAFIHDSQIQHPTLPWAPESVVSKQVLPKKHVWSHTLYAHLYDSRLVAERLKEVYGADQGYQEPQFRESALFAAKFTMAGQMVDDSFVLSSEAWFLGQVLTGKDWTRGFEDDQRAIGDRAKRLLGCKVSCDALRELTKWTLQFLGVADFFGDMERRQFRFRSQPVKPAKPEPEDDPLNSFLLDDLADVADSIGKGVTSAPLDQYLRQHDSRPRLHVDDDRASLALIDRLMPNAYANSCWPTERHLGLVHSQQLAVNTILSTLANGQGLLGVNGPPGTGKTTLLRDLIAAIITSRADALAKQHRASDGFERNGQETANDGGKPQASYKLNPALYGFEIVVASSNNGAVENITLELPQRNKIDESWLPEAEHFAELGELITEQSAWGLISGALGSKARRSKFVNRYFYGQPPFASDGKKELEAEHEDDVESDEEIDNVVDALFSCPSTVVERDDNSDDHDDTPPEEEKGMQGFLGWLNVQVEVNKTRHPEQRQALWQQAVSDYEAAKAEESKACVDASRIHELIKAISQAREKIADQSAMIHTLEQKLADTVNQLSRLDTEEGRPVNATLKQCLDALEKHHTRKPGFGANLFSLWKAQRDWNTTQERLESQCNLARAEFARIARLTKQLDTARESLEKQIADAYQALQRLQDRGQVLTENAAKLASACQADHLLAWLQGDAIGRGDAIELNEPWRIEGWRQARARVFLQALKLHKTFFELEAYRMRANLFLINGLLTGPRCQGFSCDAIRSAWASLFMVVPVLGSTFASFTRSFGSLGVGEIGWLAGRRSRPSPPASGSGCTMAIPTRVAGGGSPAT